MRDWVSKADLLDYLEANMRVYNRYGRRDNKFKARIKILVNELGLAEYQREVDAEFAAQRDAEKVVLPQAEVDRITAYFALEIQRPAGEVRRARQGHRRSDAHVCALGEEQSSRPHRVPGYISVHIALKPQGVVARRRLGGPDARHRRHRRALWATDDIRVAPRAGYRARRM